jgi:hypothetical protein
MSTLQEIEAAIEQLSPSELLKLSKWIGSRFSDLRDDEIEKDIEAGKFDSLAQEALAEFRAGKAG